MTSTKFALLAIFSTFYFNCSGLVAGGVFPLGALSPFGIQDTLLSQTFQSENDFSYFIANEFGVKENIEQVNKQRIDSLYQVLNKDKKILIPKKDLIDFCAMDSTMHHQLAITAETALLETKILIDEVRKVNGTFIFVAHNNLIGKDSEFKGFQESFEEIIQYAKE